MGVLSAGEPEQARARLRAMVAVARHRGPDGDGACEIACGKSCVILGHTRLSILDLSDDAHQPLHDPESGSWLTFNGEIYNFRALRQELEQGGTKVVSSGDSEVLLKALVHWGETALEKIEGMFAFAFWNGRAESLLLARDRTGIKPLYFFSHGSEFAFASEVKILHRGCATRLQVDPDAIDSFLAFGAVTGPRTIFREIEELEPGSLLRISAAGALEKKRYWSLHNIAAASQVDANEEFEHAVERTRKCLDLAVEAHLVSDVPVGVFLSGGVDSSVLALLASQHAKQPITLLTVAFPERRFSELPFAQRIVQQIPSRHQHEVVTLSADGLRDLIPRALCAMDQPTLDGMNTYVISQAAAALGLKVVLTGIGGDELFGGYSTFTYVPKLLKYGLEARSIAPLMAKVRGSDAPRWRKIAAAGRIQKLSQAYLLQRSIQWREQPFRRTSQALENGLDTLNNDFQKIAVLELEFYLRCQLLRDADVFSMANSVELRVPFLDRYLMQTALTICPANHFASGRGKRITWKILRDLAGEIPPRNKIGFTFPWKQWLGRELRETINDTLRQKSLYDSLQIDFQHGESLMAGLERGDRSQSWAEVWSLFVLLNWQSRGTA